MTFNCGVPKCSSSSLNNPELTFQYLPKKGNPILANSSKYGHKIYMDRRDVWLQKIKVPDPGNKMLLVCSKHFTAKDYLNRNVLPGARKERPLLRATSVPSQFLPNDESGNNIQEIIKFVPINGNLDSGILTNLVNCAGTETLQNMVFRIRQYHLERMYDMLFGDVHKEWIKLKPSLGGYVYPCYACRHLFSSFRILQDHLNVRILIIQFKCADCQDKYYIFYNSCALLLHVRSHFTDTGGQINLDEIKTDILPVELAGFLPIPEIPMLYETEEDMIGENIYINVKFYSPKENQKRKQIVELKADNLIFNENDVYLALKQVCKNVPKCQFITVEEQNQLRESCIMVNEVETETETTPAIKEEELDYVEQLTLPVISKVESLHEKAYNVPNCLDCHNKSTHVSMALHYHGNNRPVDSNLTCKICNFIAPTRCSFLAHGRLHKNEAPHVCPDCGKDFESAELLSDHIDDVCFHLAKHVKYSCPGKRCSKLFATRANFSTHFKNHFKVAYACNICRGIIYSTELIKEHMLIHSGNCKLENIYRCEVCTNLPHLNEEQLNEHVKFHVWSDTCNVYVYMCKHCHKNFRSAVSFAGHLLRCPHKKTLTALTKVRSIKKYCCVLCKETMPIDQQTAHHSSCRYANPVVIACKLSESYISAMTSAHSTSPKPVRSNEFLESTKKKRKRYLTDISKRRKPDTLPDLIAEKPMEFDGTYYCKLCDYKSLDRTEFHTHVRTHRDISAAYQCMECGECFVVKPTLFKHLRHYHNISNHESYLQENDCYDPDVVKVLESHTKSVHCET